MGVGRPTSYKDEYAGQAKKLCELGATDMDLADFFGVDVRTIHRWKVQHEQFCHSLMLGKKPADDNVERALYHRAIGYSHPDIDIRVINNEIVETPITKVYPPDTKALLAWLYNRRSDEWHPKPEGKDAGDDSMAEVLRDLIKKLPG